MPNPISETLRHLHNIGYMHVHKNERPFPLNGSEWARLVNERVGRERHACMCHRCYNFLTRLHSKESPLGGERVGVRRAMHYWFLQGTPTYGSSWSAESEPLATDALQGLMDSDDDTLQAAEKRWLKDNTHLAHEMLMEGVTQTYSVEELDALKSPVVKVKNEKGRTKSEDKFWEADSCDYYESRPQERKSIYHEKK